MFSYIVKRFGKDHVAQIITYGTEKLRSGIDDLCRTLKQYDEDGNVVAYGQDVADVIKKTVPFKFPDQTEPTYAKMMDLADDPEQFREKFRDQTEKMNDMAKEFKKYMQQFPEIDKGLQFIEGLIRNYGKHAAAVVITDDPITDYIPVYKLNKDDVMPVTAFSMKEIDGDLNMLKLDALSLSTMTVVRKAVQNVQQTNPSFDIRKVDLYDEDTLKTIRDGNTVGVFQVSGGPITAYTKRVRPQEFDNIVDVLALFRPGPLEALVDKNTTMADKYIDNANDQDLKQFMSTIPEDLQDIYKDTRGILIYQEQIMAVAQRMAGYSLGGADLLRRAIG